MALKAIDSARGCAPDPSEAAFLRTALYIGLPNGKATRAYPRTSRGMEIQSFLTIIS